MPPISTFQTKTWARGFYPRFFTHDYLVVALAPASLRGAAGLAAIGLALRANPTPGKDKPATARGTVNNVGDLVLGDGDTNLVRSFGIQSSNAKRSDAVVNYTVAGRHSMEEGFVMRYAEIRRNKSIELITYREGNAFKMSEFFSDLWRPAVRKAWMENAAEVFEAASRGK